ncbi:MAG: HEAT repeat domain-containing protein [Pseudomonadota bacterium]
MEALSDPDWRVRRAAAEALGTFSRHGEKTVPGLLDLLHDPKSEVRSSAAIALGKLGQKSPAVAQALEELGRNADPGTKLSVAIALTLLGKAEDDWIPFLIDAVGSPDESTAEASAMALRRLVAKKPEKLLAGILDVVKEAKEAQILRLLHVLRALGPFAHNALPRLEPFYDNLSIAGRTELLSAFTAIDKEGDSAVRLLKRGVKSPEPDVRREALVGFLRYRSKSDLYLGSLMEALDDRDLKNRVITLRILRGLSAKASEAVPKVLSATGDANPQVRTEALKTLAALAKPDAEMVRICGQRLSDRDQGVQCAAVRTLQKVAVKEPDLVVPLLEEALKVEKQEKIRKCIGSALQSIARKSGGPRG